ncbi:hypothetical protein FPV67DRAFT_1690110 [Lyophyllum atratum]|nr:hypothetical protein FPV67DRAFT_1690110 [Lyophyllum atratum]
MSALNFARQAFSREKPHSSITDWVDILTSSGIEEEAYDGIPELVDAINLQAAGPAEASRALRKKLKHGNPHQQYRSLVLLKALVENCGAKFQTSFADAQLTDALKNLSAESNVDKRVRKKLLLVLVSWQNQFKDDPSMSLIAGLHKQCSRDGRRRSYQEVAHLIGLPPDDKRREEAKRQAKKEKEKAKTRREEEERERRLRQGPNQPQRTPFVFEKDKPKVLASIAEASQASSNLVNAITLVNPETDSIQTNERVQECLIKAKQAKKPVVRYIQLVENEELIGTLIETNDRIMDALEMYDNILGRNPKSGNDTSGLSADLAAAHTLVRVRMGPMYFRNDNSPPYKEKAFRDLSFGPLGASSSNLPPPLRPSARDYSSDEETLGGASGSMPGQRPERNYVHVSDDPGDEPYARAPLTEANDDDPFADPFADEVAVGPTR